MLGGLGILRILGVLGNYENYADHRGRDARFPSNYGNNETINDKSHTVI